MKSDKHENIDWLRFERELWHKGFRRVAGVDEAGRGPLAGPVVTAAVILRPGADLPGVVDSKRMTELQREEAFEYILKNCQAAAVTAASAKMIDRINILRATMLSMERSVNRLDQCADFVLVDGNRFPKDIMVTGEAVIGGDRLSRSIAAASVIAKVTRDRLMRRLDRLYPQFGFARNKGYGTREHIRAIHKFGPTPHHRYSFNPVRQYRLSLEDEQ